MLLERHLGQPVHVGFKSSHIAGQRLVALPLRPDRAAGEFRQVIVGVAPADRQNADGVDIGREMARLAFHRLHAAFKGLHDREAVASHFHCRHVRCLHRKAPARPVPGGSGDLISDWAIGRRGFRAHSSARASTRKRIPRFLPRVADLFTLGKVATVLFARVYLMSILLALLVVAVLAICVNIWQRRKFRDGNWYEISVLPWRKFRSADGAILEGPLVMRRHVDGRWEYRAPTPAETFETDKRDAW